MRASCSLASAAARRSVSSRVSLAKPRNLPAPSHSGVMITLAQNWLPSRRTRQPSVTPGLRLDGVTKLLFGDTGLSLVRRDRRRRNAGRRSRLRWYPLIRSAPRFQVETIPVGLSVNTAYSPAPSTSSLKASLASGGSPGRWLRRDQQSSRSARSRRQAGPLSLSAVGDGMPFSSPWAVQASVGARAYRVGAGGHGSTPASNICSLRPAMLRRWLLPPVKRWGTWSGRAGRAVLAEERTLPLVAALADLFPGKSLRRGSTVVVSRGAFPGATSLALALLSGPCAGGSWCAVVGAAELGLVAAAQHGLDLERLALVPSPGAQWPVVTAALLEGFDVVLVCPPPVSAALLPASSKPGAESGDRCWPSWGRAGRARPTCAWASWPVAGEAWKTATVTCGAARWRWKRPARALLLGRAGRRFWLGGPFQVAVDGRPVLGVAGPAVAGRALRPGPLPATEPRPVSPPGGGGATWLVEGRLDDGTSGLGGFLCRLGGHMHRPSAVR